MEIEERQWRQDHAVAEGTEALDGMIKSFRFILEQLEDQKKRWDEIVNGECRDNFEATSKAVGQVKILSRSAQIASSQLNSTVGQAVMAAAKIASLSDGDAVKYM